MTDKDYKLYGTKILNLLSANTHNKILIFDIDTERPFFTKSKISEKEDKTQEIGLLICLWTNKFADGDIDCLGLFGSFSLPFRFRKFINFLSLHQTFTLTGLLRIALPKIRFATCIDKKGKRYNIELDNIRGVEDDFMQ